MSPIIVVLWLFGTLAWFGMIVGAIYVGTKLANRPPRDSKRCPWCAEAIRPEAIVCRWCGRDVS